MTVCCRGVMVLNPEHIELGDSMLMYPFSGVDIPMLIPQTITWKGWQHSILSSWFNDWSPSNDRAGFLIRNDLDLDAIQKEVMNIRAVKDEIVKWYNELHYCKSEWVLIRVFTFEHPVTGRYVLDMVFASPNGNPRRATLSCFSLDDLIYKFTTGRSR